MMPPRDFIPLINRYDPQNNRAIDELLRGETIDPSRTIFDPDRVPDFKPIIARNNIMKHWLDSGGPSSALGLPLDPAFPLISNGDHFMIEFRGGNVTINNHDSHIAESEMRRVVVTFEGFGLEIRQEDGDEIFGSVHAQVGSTGFKQDFVIPEINLGPEGNNRISQNGIVLYHGPPVDLNIVLSLVEHDSGDRNQVRAEVRQRVAEIFRSAEDLATAGLAGSAVQKAAGAINSEALASSSLKNWLIGGVGDLINDLLGMGDDPYNPVGFTIPVAEMRHIPPTHEYRCSSDPRIVRYTHSRMTLCRDDGGDIGQITALFSVRPQ